MTLVGTIRDDIACVFERDPAARSTLEILATYPGVHALIWHRIANRLWRGGWRFSARFVSWLGRFRFEGPQSGEPACRPAPA